MRFGKCAALAMLFAALGLTDGKPCAAESAFFSSSVSPIKKTSPRRSTSQSVQVAPMSPHTPDSRLPVLIISDPKDYGDDGIAILMLLRSRRINVRGIVSTSGNVCASRGAREATRLARSAGAGSIPVIQGFPFSWHNERRRFYQEVERPAWPRPVYVGAFADRASCDEEKSLSDSDAADFVIERGNASPDGLTIVLIGPATVLAEALRRAPQITDRIRRIYAMGGALAVAGNVTPYAEFNVWFDPEAMAAILASKVPVTLVPLDTTQDITYDGVPLSDGPPRDFAAKYMRTYLDRAAAKGNSVRMWDEVLASIVIDPAIAETTRQTYLSVSTTKDEQYGRLIASHTAVNSRPVDVVTGVQSAKARQLVRRLLLDGN